MHTVTTGLANRLRRPRRALLLVAALALVGADARALDYPPTRRGAQVDDYFGTRVADPYRWLEDDNAPETRAWVRTQRRLTAGYLRRIPFRTRVLARIRALSDYPKTSGVFVDHSQVYLFRNDGLQNQPVLYRQHGFDAEPERVLDPNTFSPDGTVSLTAFEISPDGRYAAYGRSAIPGSDWEEFRVLDLNTGATLPDVVRWSRYSTPAWHGDGFFYSRQSEPAKGSELTVPARDMTVWFHRVGTPQGADTLVFEDRVHPGWYHEIATTPDGRFESLYERDPSRRGARLSVRDTAVPNSAFVQVADVSDADVTVVGHIGGRLLVQTRHGAPNGKLMRVDLDRPAEARWQTVLPERAETLQRVTIAGGRLFAHYLKDVASRIEVFDAEGRREAEIALPGPGSATVAADHDHDGDATEVLYRFESLNQPPTTYRYEIATGRSAPFQPSQVPGFDPAGYESRQVFFESRDGTRIPMFLVHRKGLVLDGRNPTLLYGYGGFNITLAPRFNAARIAWLEQGGVYALANLRGGGEYGEAWHEAGMQLKKQTVFDDCIAAAEYLIREKITAPDRLALQGGSNGGLLVGAVVNQRPDLFRVALPQVGVMDMLRFQKFSAGSGWVADYGSSDDPVQFRALLRYSPLHNIRRGATYPATLVSTADHDDRVVPAHSFKYIATLQARAGKRSGPLLIRIETRSGHGASNLGKRLEGDADAYSFAWFNMGFVPTYPP